VNWNNQFVELEHSDFMRSNILFCFLEQLSFMLITSDFGSLEQCFDDFFDENGEEDEDCYCLSEPSRVCGLLFSLLGCLRKCAASSRGPYLRQPAQHITAHQFC
jgi:hypothetical protein